MWHHLAGRLCSEVLMPFCLGDCLLLCEDVSTGVSVRGEALVIFLSAPNLCHREASMEMQRDEMQGPASFLYGNRYSLYTWESIVSAAPVNQNFSWWVATLKINNRLPLLRKLLFSLAMCRGPRPVGNLSKGIFAKAHKTNKAALSSFSRCTGTRFCNCGGDDPRIGVNAKAVKGAPVYWDCICIATLYIEYEKIHGVIVREILNWQIEFAQRTKSPILRIFEIKYSEKGFSY